MSSFSTVEESGFKKLLLDINKDLQIPFGITIQSDTMLYFKESKYKLKNIFVNLKTKIVLTTDIWTSSTNRPYLTITSHFIAIQKKLSSVLIEFCLVPHPHTGEQVKQTLLNALNEYEILLKIISITTDNASNNKKGINIFNLMLEKI
jgi:hypothetical protein